MSWPFVSGHQLSSCGTSLLETVSENSTCFFGSCVQGGAGEVMLLSSSAKFVGVCSLASKSSMSIVPLMKGPFFFLFGEVT